MRESRGRPRHTPGREHETHRNIQRREEYKGGEGKRTIPPKRGDPEGTGGRNPYTPMLLGSGNLKPLEDMEEGRGFKVCYNRRYFLNFRRYLKN
jgi:hypothetical protein